MEEERVVDPSLLMRPPAPVPAPPPPPAVPVPPPPGPRASPLDIRWCRERTREETGGAAGGGGGAASSTEPQADRLSLSAIVSSGLVVAGAVTDPLRDMVVALPPWGRESTQSVQHESKVPFVCCVLSGLSAGAAKRAGILFFFKTSNIGQRLHDVRKPHESNFLQANTYSRYSVPGAALLCKDGVCESAERGSEYEETACFMR